ncbi:hypothetical protein T492DRAFT_1147907, partial [Pavlovales sp. CCMP2436]
MARGLLAVLAACAAAAPAHAAFLPALPLNVTSVLPGPARGVRDDEDARPLRGRDAITVVFSRAVIALGADFDASPPAFTLAPAHVPGRFRWVTTAIARFDPSVDWPPELTVEVAPLAGLTSFDGTRLGSSAQPVRYRTPALRLWLETVRSDAARNATGGVWDPYTANEHGEMPVDGHALLRFSAAISPMLALAALNLRALDGDRAPALRLGCDQSPTADNSSLCVRSTEPLTPGHAYAIELRAGRACHPLQGAVSSPSSVEVQGLAPFFLPFLQRLPPPPAQAYRELKPRFHRYDLWMRHGLAPLAGDEGSESEEGEAHLLEALRTSVSLSPPLHFDLSRPSRGVLRVEAAFEPGARYTLRVDAARASAAGVRDAFGQPLVADPRPLPDEDGGGGGEGPLAALAGAIGASVGAASSAPLGESTSFVTAELPAFFSDSEAHALFAPPHGAPASLRVWARGADQCLGAEWTRGMPAGERCAPKAGGEAAFGAWAEHALAQMQPYPRERMRARLLLGSRFGEPMSVGLAPVTRSTLRAAIATVLSDSESFVDDVASARAPLTNASVSLRLETAAALVPSGLAVRTRWTGYDAYAAAGEPGARKSSRCGRVPRARRVQLRVRWRAPADSGNNGGGPGGFGGGGRGFGFAAPPEEEGPRRIGEVFLRAGEEVEEVAVEGGCGEFVPADGSVCISLEADGEFGAFDAELKVPADAEHAVASLELLLVESDASTRRVSYAHLASAPLTLAEPRPPSATLELIAVDAAGRPRATFATFADNEPVRLRLRAATYTGTPVGGARVTLSWELTAGGAAGGAEPSADARA